jgi:hypothetical protein
MIIIIIIIIIIIARKLLKGVRHEKLLNVVIDLHFKIFNLKKSNNDVCLADTFLVCGDLVNWQLG